jgi:hypothetical protein
MVQNNERGEAAVNASFSSLTNLTFVRDRCIHDEKNNMYKLGTRAATVLRSLKRDK